MKYNIIRILSLLLALQCMQISFAQTELSLQECREKALSHNRTLSAAKTKLSQTEFDMKSYKANFFPQMSLMATDFYSTASGDFTISGGHLPIYKYVEAAGQYVPDVTINPDGSYKFNSYADFPDQKMDWKLKNVFVGAVQLMQPIYSGGKISTAYNMSKLGVSMATENIRLTESEVLVKTDEAYYLAIKARELGGVARSYKTLLEELKKNVEAAFRHGLKTRNDIMKVQVKLNEAELSIQKADNAYRLALMNLCHIIGMPLDSEISVDASAVSFVEGSSAGSSVADITARPEYSILEKKTELARQNIKLTKSSSLPTVVAGAAYTYANGGELAGKRLIDNGSATVGVSVNVPISVFGGESNKVRSAKAAYQIAQLEQQDMNEKMQLELAQSANAVSEAETELALCETSLQQAAENMKLSKQQYEVGFEPLSDYLETQALWQQANANLVQARCQLQLAKIKYKKASGGM